MTKSKKKAAPKKKAAKKKKRTPTQLANIARRGPQPTGDVKPHPYAGLFGNRNAVGNKGRPPAYETPEEMDTQVDAYFEWIKGEYEDREEEIKVIDPKTKTEKKVKIKNRVCLREPEPPTRTGLMLFMGFHSLQCWATYEAKTDTEFPSVVARARARVAQGYEKALWNKDTQNGAKFALTNIVREDWQNTQSVQPLGKDGKPVDPAPAAVITVGSFADSLNKV